MHILILFPIFFSLAFTVQHNKPEKKSVPSLDHPLSEKDLAEPVRVLNAYKFEIEYPSLAKTLEIEGVVELLVGVRPDGSVYHAQVLHGIGFGCDEVALKLVKQFRFTPPKTKQLKPTHALIHHRIRFRLY